MVRFAGLICLIAAPLGVFCDRAPEIYELELERAVRLECEAAYNLSGLAFGADGYLYFTDDNGPAPGDWEPKNPVFLRVKVDDVLDPANEAPSLEPLEVAGEAEAYAALAASCEKAFKYDLEGVTALENGKLWACDERDRLLLEYDPAARTLGLVASYQELAMWDDRLAEGRINNGFEGIAVIGDWLFLAHEMFPNLIVRYRLKGGAVTADTVFTVEGSSDLTGLESDGGKLYALGRTGSAVYRLDPKSGRVKAGAFFGREADNPEYRFRQRDDSYRNSEGLALGRGRIFIVLDGNFQSTMTDEKERRPLLLIYKRPGGF